MFAFHRSKNELVFTGTGSEFCI